jgi:hypothetical protein
VITVGSALEYIWTALVIVGLLATFAMVISTAWTGKFWWGRLRNGRRWPPLRSEAPVKFWLLWMLYSGPILLIALLIIGGIAMSNVQH